MSRPISLPRWSLYILVFGLYLTVRGYHSRDGDQAYRLPILLHQQDPSLFADDPFVSAFHTFNPHQGYLALLDFASRPFGLSFALFALFAATFALTCYGIDRLARSVWPEAGESVGLIAVALVLLAKAGNIGTNHLFEAMLLDRLVGFSLGWVALALAIEGRILVPSLLIGVATIVHPSVGLQLGGVLGVTWFAWAIGRRVTAQSWRSTGLGMVTLVLAVLPGALSTLGQSQRLFEGMSPHEFRSLGVELQMAQHMVPSLWRTPQWLAWGGFIVLGLVSLFRLGVRSNEDSFSPLPSVATRRFAILFGVVLLGLGVAYLAIEGIRDLRVTVFQPFRMATIARGLALVAAAGRCRMLWVRGDVLGKLRVSLLATGLAGDWTFVVAVAVELVATLSEAGILKSRWTTDWSRSAIIATASLGMIVLWRHDTERGHVLLLGAVVVAILAHRFRFVWTRRRFALAYVVAWSFPIAAIVIPAFLPPEHPLVVGLSARCRFDAVPSDDIERLAVWCRSNTASDAKFITPPGPKTFRLWSLRSVAFNRAASPYHAAGLRDWSDRFRAHVRFEGTTEEFVRSYLADRHGVEGRYAKFSHRELASLAATQSADHVIASAPVERSSENENGGLQLLKVEGRYAVYRVVAADLSVRNTEGRLR